MAQPFFASLSRHIPAMLLQVARTLTAVATQRNPQAADFDQIIPHDGRAETPAEAELRRVTLGISNVILNRNMPCRSANVRPMDARP